MFVRIDARQMWRIKAIEKGPIYPPQPRERAAILSVRKMPPCVGIPSIGTALFRFHRVWAVISLRTIHILPRL